MFFKDRSRKKTEKLIILSSECKARAQLFGGSLSLLIDALEVATGNSSKNRPIFSNAFLQTRFN